MPPTLSQSNIRCSAKLYPDGWLFGEWSIADAMYAPLALRFQTYGIELSEGAKAYQQKVLAGESLQQWLVEASQETDIIEEGEAGVEVSLNVSEKYSLM